MFIKRVLTCAALLLSISVNAQSQYRFKDMLFKEVTIDENLNYGNSADKKAHLFDIYQPHDDNTPKRPLIIWMHGGGFLFGSKDAKGIKLWSNTFAQRGYVCAAINYTLSKKSPIFGLGLKDIQKSSYYAVQDLKMAIAYFKLNADKYRLDTNKIILAGNSAGGIMALQTAFTNNAELAEQVGLSKSDVDTHSSGIVKIAGVINFWGAIFDIHWLSNAKVPIVSAYGSQDGVVDPGHKSAPIYGAQAIHKEADEIKLPNAVKVFEGYSHELQKHFNPIFSPGKDTEERWLQAGQFAADFLYEQLFVEKAKPGTKTKPVDSKTAGTRTTKNKKGQLVTANTDPVEKPLAQEKVKPVADTGTSLDYRTMWPGSKPAAKKKAKQ